MIKNSKPKVKCKEERGLEVGDQRTARRPEKNCPTGQRVARQRKDAESALRPRL